MFIAVDGFFRPVHIDETIPGAHYQCPRCGMDVFTRGGDKIARHFAHKKRCLDDWTYEKTEWHKNMQSLWPKDNQEVTVKFNGETHRADVLINDIVIEIQQSHMSASEFRKRTSFFLSAGYRVVWIFNFTEAYRIGNLRSSHFSKYYHKKYVYNWSNPIKTLSYAPDVFENNQFAVWAWIDQYHSKLERLEYISKGTKQTFSLKEFHVGGKDINFDYPIEPECFFGKMQTIKQTNKQFVALNTGVRIPAKLDSYKRYVGERGHPKIEYTCPRRRQDDWIRIGGDSGCRYCKACKGIYKKLCNGRVVYEVTCDFPNLTTLDKQNPNPRRETDGAFVIDLTK